MDLTDAHSARVAKMVHILGGSDSEVIAALLHDVGEKKTGDVSYETKREHPAIRAILRAAEAPFVDACGLHSYEVEVTPLVALCDQMDAYLFAKEMAPDLMDRSDWVAHLAYILDLADNLGMKATVAEVLKEGKHL